jgi:hypothetical protein
MEVAVTGKTPPAVLLKYLQVAAATFVMIDMVLQ